MVAVNRVSPPLRSASTLAATPIQVVTRVPQGQKAHWVASETCGRWFTRSLQRWASVTLLLAPPGCTCLLAAYCMVAVERMSPTPQICQHMGGTHKVRSS
jgi:hypothetical protein